MYCHRKKIKTLQIKKNKINLCNKHKNMFKNAF